MLTPRQIHLVETTWQQLLPSHPAVADQFYARLFELAPEVRPLFRHDIHAQGSKLTTMLSLAVAQLGHLELLRPSLEALAQRHWAYGVRDAHYDAVGQALLWTLQQGLGPAFVPAVREAWTAAYGALAGVMRQAAAGRPDPAGEPAGAASAAEPGMAASQA